MNKFLMMLACTAALLVAGQAQAKVTKGSWKLQNVSDGVVNIDEGETVTVTFAFEGSCSDVEPSAFQDAAKEFSSYQKGCFPSKEQLGTDGKPLGAAVKYVLSPTTTAAYRFTYEGVDSKVYTFWVKPAYNPTAHPSKDEYNEHIGDFEDHVASSQELQDGTFQILAQLGGMPNDKYFQRPAFVARLLLNATLARARWGGGFKLGLLGGYGETNFRVSPAFASLTEEAPVRIGEWALMPQFTHRPINWFEWNAGIPLGLRYYSYEAQILSLDPGNMDALENNNRQFVFWMGIHADAQFIIADYLSLGGFAQFSVNPTQVDVIIGDDQDKGELMPQFTGGAIVGLDI